MKKVLLAWSSGKDSAWTLHALRRQNIEVSALLHSFVYDGPMFRGPVPIEAGEARNVDGFIYTDLLCPASSL